jgi:hypothetical protein
LFCGIISSSRGKLAAADTLNPDTSQPKGEHNLLTEKENEVQRIEAAIRLGRDEILIDAEMSAEVVVRTAETLASLYEKFDVAITPESMRHIIDAAIALWREAREAC